MIESLPDILRAFESRLRSLERNTSGGKVSDLLKSINRQDDTTDSLVENQLIQSGWGWKVGDATNRILSEAITFPVAFDDAPIVVVSFLGIKASADPTAITDFLVTTAGTYGLSCGTITTAGFSIALNRVSIDGGDPGVFASANRHGYSWIAIGTKAR